jgi:hypothetical protein
MQVNSRMRLIDFAGDRGCQFSQREACELHSRIEQTLFAGGSFASAGLLSPILPDALPTLAGRPFFGSSIQKSEWSTGIEVPVPKFGHASRPPGTLLQH